MNETVLIPKPPYNLQRIIAKICITIGKQPLLHPKMRLKMLKLGGIKIGKTCFIGANVEFDGIYPNLIEIGDRCIITTVARSHPSYPDERI